MASADYRLCDVCSSKAFYDSNLNYTYEYEHNAKWGPFEPTRWAGEASPHGPMLDDLGDWAVLCRECAKTHMCTVVKREPPAKEEP